MELDVIANQIRPLIARGMVIYMLLYALLESNLARRLKESTYLAIMPISNRITAFVMSYGFCFGLLKLAEVIISLAHGEKPDAPTVTAAVICAVLIYPVIRYRSWKWCWYYLTKPTRTIKADWYMRKYFAADVNDWQRQYQYLLKASELKSDSVFIWSMLALFNEDRFENSSLADEYLVKARQTLSTMPNPSAQDRSLVESVTGDILLCREQIDEGLAHLKIACDLDPSDANIGHYQNTLKRLSEPDEDTAQPEVPPPTF